MNQRLSQSQSQGKTESIKDAIKFYFKEIGLEEMLISNKHFNKKDGIENLISGLIAILATMPVSSIVRSGISSDDENGWKEIFDKGRIIVKNNETCRLIMKNSFDDLDAFSIMVKSLAVNGAIVLPLKDYPGMKIPL